MSSVLRRVAATLCICTSLGACQTINELSGSGSDAPPPVTVDTPAPPVAAPIAPAGDAGRSGSLSGMNGDQLLSLWGEPTLRRKETGSELWTYGKPRSGCSLLVYLYPDSGGLLTVMRGEALPGGAGDAAIDSCARANDLSSVKPVS